MCSYHHFYFAAVAMSCCRDTGHSIPTRSRRRSDESYFHSHSDAGFTTGLSPN
jgi:hypothetical protein